MTVSLNSLQIKGKQHKMWLVPNQVKHTSIHNAKLAWSQHLIREYLVHRGNILQRENMLCLLALTLAIGQNYIIKSPVKMLLFQKVFWYWQIFHIYLTFAHYRSGTETNIPSPKQWVSSFLICAHFHRRFSVKKWENTTFRFYHNRCFNSTEMHAGKLCNRAQKWTTPHSPHSPGSGSWTRICWWTALLERETHHVSIFNKWKTLQSLSNCSQRHIAQIFFFSQPSSLLQLHAISHSPTQWSILLHNKLAIKLIREAMCDRMVQACNAFHNWEFRQPQGLIPAF